jgi:replicative DNA helicase
MEPMELSFKDLTTQLLDKTKYSKQRPASLEAEIRLITCCLADNIRYDSLSGRIRAEHFYYVGLRHVWDAIGELLSGMELNIRDNDTRQDISPFMLKGHLKKMGRWQFIELELQEYEIVSSVEDIFNYDKDGEPTHYAKMIVECWRLRTLNECAELMSRMIAEGRDSKDVARVMGNAMTLTSKNQAGDDAASPAMVAAITKKEIYDELDGDGYSICVEMQQTVLNAAFCGALRFRECSMCCGLTGHGKTSTALAVIQEASRIGAMTLMFFAEGSIRDMVIRSLVARFSHRDENRQLRREYPLLNPKWLESPSLVPERHRPAFKEQLDRALDWYAEESGLYLKQDINLVAEDIQRYIQMRRAMEPKRPMVVIVDYAQYCSVEDPFVRGETENISGAVKLLSACAANYDCAMIILAQHNEVDDQMPYACPRPNDVRQSKDLHKVPANFTTVHKPYDGHSSSHLNSLVVFDVGKNRKGKQYYVMATIDYETGAYGWFDGELDAQDIAKIGLQHRKRLYSHNWREFINGPPEQDS